MVYERKNSGYWYCTTPHGRLYVLKKDEHLNRKRRMKALKRSRARIRRLGLRVK